jgi:methionine synthase II (cobalamin-independent)
MTTTKITASCNGSVPFTAVGRPRGNDVMIGCIDVASNVVETPQDVADTIRAPPTRRICSKDI